MSGKAIRTLFRWISAFIDVQRLLAWRFFPRYLIDWRRYRKLAGCEPIPWSDSYPCLNDRTPFTSFDPHYFYQAAWLARQLVERKPERHIDIGSSIAMLSVLSAFVPIVFLDYRPIRVKLKGLLSTAGNLLQLPFPNNSLSSISCLHVIEHIGLGRYGDPLNPKGSHQAAREIIRVLKPGGRLYLSVPVGRKQRTQFNAHRIFTVGAIAGLFEGLQIESFDMVDDSGTFIQHADLLIQSHSNYGCGLFIMTKYN